MSKIKFMCFPKQNPLMQSNIFINSPLQVFSRLQHSPNKSHKVIHKKEVFEKISFKNVFIYFMTLFTAFPMLYFTSPTILELPVCTSQVLHLFHSVPQPSSPLATISLFSMSVSVLLVSLHCYLN